LIVCSYLRRGSSERQVIQAFCCLLVGQSLSEKEDISGQK